ncbi:hypothetical protein OH76DRAFT_1344992, partial [Lentinus brumalis]
LARRSRSLLRPFLHDYEGFVSKLHITGSVLTGGSALHVLYPSMPAPDDLKVCASKETFFHIVAYLVHCEGYTPKLSRPRPSVSAYYADLTRDGHKIRIVRSPTSSPLHPIVCHWHTGLFGYLSPARFSVPYASLTTNRRALVMGNHMDEDGNMTSSLQDRIRVWQDDGWQITLRPPGSAAERARCRGVASPVCAVGRRHFGDSHCLSGPTHALRHRVLPALAYDCDSEWTVFWWRGGRTCGANCYAGKTMVNAGHRPCLCAIVRTGSR